MPPTMESSIRTLFRTVFTPMVILLGGAVLAMALSPSPGWAEQKGAVVKQVCLSSFGMGWKTSEDGKVHLLSLAKREAVSELFGDLIRAETRIENFQLKKDEIDLVSAGVVRIEGAPEYFNGSGFGEACVRVTAYVSDEDRARFRPTKVTKKACIGDSKLSADALRKAAEKAARIQAVTDFEPRLDGASEEVVLSLLHEATVVEGGFLPGGATYCAMISGKIVPVEASTVARRPGTKDPSVVRERQGGTGLAAVSTVEIGDVVFNLGGCSMVAIGAVSCDFTVSSRSDDELRLFLYGAGKTGFEEDRADLVDGMGSRFHLSEIALGKKKTGDRFNELEHVLKPNAGPASGTLRYSGPKQESEIGGPVTLRVFISNGKVGERQEVRFPGIGVRR